MRPSKGHCPVAAGRGVWPGPSRPTGVPAVSAESSADVPVRPHLAPGTAQQLARGQRRRRRGRLARQRLDRPSAEQPDWRRQDARRPRVRSGGQARFRAGAGPARATTGAHRRTACTSISKDNVWVGFGGGLPYDLKSKATTDNAHILKFTPDGKFLLQFGKFGEGTEGSNSTTLLGQPTDIAVDRQGERGLHHRRLHQPPGHRLRREHRRLQAALGCVREAARRCADAGVQAAAPRRASSSTRRTASRSPTTDWSTSATAAISASRCSARTERSSRTRSSTPNWPTARWAARRGTSRSRPIAQQTFIFLADGGNHRVHTLRRDSLEVVATFGRRGRWAGQFESPHSIAIDSKGNLFVAETLDGRRVQKFSPR